MNTVVEVIAAGPVYVVEVLEPAPATVIEVAAITGPAGPPGPPGGTANGDINANPLTIAQRTDTGALRSQTPNLMHPTAHPDDVINRSYASPYLLQVVENTQAVENLATDLADTDSQVDGLQTAVVTLAGNMDNLHGRVVTLENAPHEVVTYQVGFEPPLTGVADGTLWIGWT